jgi:cytochrome c-type biogenesis protein CcmF
MNGAAPREMEPLFIVRGNEVTGVADTLHDLGLFTRFANVIPQLNAAVIETKQRDAKDEYIVLKALLFPYINVLWLGVITMVLGFGLSLINRATKKEVKNAKMVA